MIFHKSWVWHIKPPHPRGGFLYPKKNPQGDRRAP